MRHREVQQGGHHKQREWSTEQHLEYTELGQVVAWRFASTRERNHSRPKIVQQKELKYVARKRTVQKGVDDRGRAFTDEI